MKTKKDFTIIQKLSPNGVYLIREHQGLKVLREFVNNDLSKMLSILDFYKEDFPYRPIVQKV
jgi:hypothetical protein